jgi:CDGSH-type Zn-finger protein
MAVPVKIELQAGVEYHFCECGRSKNKVLCDGSHAGTSFVPTAFKVGESKEYYLCSCKNSKNKPFCDGSHVNG